jgi:hypothetical protein
VAGRRRSSAQSAAARAQPHQDRGGRLGQPQGQAGRVVTGVEHKQRHLPASGQAVQQRADLGDGDLVVVVGRMQAAGIHRRGPAVAMEAELGDPLILIRPAGHDRLAGRVP